MFFLAFNIHSNVFVIYQKLYNNNNRRTKKVLGRSLILNTVIFLIFGIIGYLTQPIKTSSIILSRNPLEGKDIIMNIIRLLIAFIIITKIPQIYNSVKKTLFNFIWDDDENEDFLKKNLLITIPFIILVLLITIFYKNVLNVISLVGGLPGIYTCITIPGFIQYKLYKDLPFFSIKELFLVFVIGGISIIGVISGVVSVIAIFI